VSFWKRRERPAPDLVQAMEAAMTRIRRSLTVDLTWMLHEDGLDNETAARRAFLPKYRLVKYLYGDGSLDQLAQLAELLGYEVTVKLERRHGR
jgi:hypothetical protein